MLCDRFTDSTEAYQGGGRKLGSEPVLELHHILCHDLQPDLTILMDSDVAASVERARRRNRAHAGRNGRSKSDENRFEQESRAFFARVRNTYLAIASRETQRVVLIDARGTANETHAKIVEVVRRGPEAGSQDCIEQPSALSYQLSVGSSAVGGSQLAQ